MCSCGGGWGGPSQVSVDLRTGQYDDSPPPRRQLWGLGLRALGSHTQAPPRASQAALVCQARNGAGCSCSDRGCCGGSEGSWLGPGHASLPVTSPFPAGLWLYMPGSSLPCLTLIGSPNFGYRSVHRDLEAQIAIVTESPALQRELHQVGEGAGSEGSFCPWCPAVSHFHDLVWRCWDAVGRAAGGFLALSQDLRIPAP